jgi:hypothetical protein
MLRLALLGVGSIGAASVIAVNVRYAMATSDTQIVAINMATMTRQGS